MLRKHTAFGADLEDLAHRAIGCCLAVHRQLGAGFVEAAYPRAVRVELTASNMPFESEKKYPIVYRGKSVYAPPRFGRRPAACGGVEVY
jgi:GxxExxY protein